MTDSFGNNLSVGDYIIVTVSRKSHYLTSAQIIEISEDLGKINVMYSSSIKTKWISPDIDTLRYDPKPFVLDGRLGLCRDCVNRVIEEGQNVAYRNKAPGCSPISFSKIKSVDSDLWVTLENEEKIRNVGIFILD